MNLVQKLLLALRRALEVVEDVEERVDGGFETAVEEADEVQRQVLGRFSGIAGKRART